jgi:hypothetical protein
MPHLKCTTCRTRLDTGERPPDLDDDLCPGCGSLLQPVGGLAEVVGYRLTHFGDDPNGDDASGASGRIAARVALIVGREPLDAHAPGEAEHRVDDGGSTR